AGQQHQQRLADLADQQVAFGPQAIAPRLLDPEALTQDGDDQRRESGPDLIGPRCGRHAHQRVHVEAAAPLWRVERYADPYLVLSLARDMEAARHHADDSARLLVERQGLAD